MPVTIMCRIQNGLLLTLATTWINNLSLALIEAEPVLLKPGANVIAGDYWDAWLLGHADADVVTKSFIYQV